jgi:predicted small lipoprotein YifL
MTDDALWRTGQVMTIIACLAVLLTCLLRGCGLDGPLVAPGAVQIEVVVTDSPVTVLAA